MKVKPGIDNLLDNYQNLLNGKKIGLLVNHSSINSKFHNSIALIKNSSLWHLRAIFVPEHGFYGDKEYMDDVESYYDPFLQLPVHSLYGNCLKPTPEMLAGIDTLIFDLQDVGVRYYTYASTLSYCMEKCAELNKELFVLDRPNPLNGTIIQGTILEQGFESFVGELPLPVRHGFTIGELALFINNYKNYNTLLTVIPMNNWRRKMCWQHTHLHWIQPSPNMPDWKTTMYYPGICLFEGTNISEGRGTTKPFEIIGAPWINPFIFAQHVNALDLPYITALPLYFTPKFSKYAHQQCGGIQLCVHSLKADTFIAAAKIIHYLYQTYPDYFQWRLPPYEFNETIMPFDLLIGTDKLRVAIEKQHCINDLLNELCLPLKVFKKNKEAFHLYK